MEYSLTEKEKVNRDRLQTMKALLKLDPDRFTVEMKKSKKYYMFILTDHRDNLKSFVEVKNKPNDFPWKWKVRKEE